MRIEREGEKSRMEKKEINKQQAKKRIFSHRSENIVIYSHFKIIFFFPKNWLTRQKTLDFFMNLQQSLETYASKLESTIVRNRTK